MSVVALEQVEKNFGATRIVRGLSLVAEAGEFLVMVGPSGCGKTTTLRMIAGLEAPTAGTIHIGGRDVTALPPKDRDVAMVFQSYALYPHLSVFDNMAFGLTLRGAPKQEIARRVSEAARILELDALLTRRPKELSGGQRQRVAIGRAIVRDPKVFLFDEPLSNLDASLRGQMRAEIAGLHRRLGATMVYVTHDQVEAMMLATRIAVLEGGELRQVGPPQELYHRPKNRFVAGFIGSPPMNFVTGVVGARGGAPVLETRGAALALPDAARALAAGARLTVGIRPHDVRVDGSAIGSAIGSTIGLGGEASIVEPMGWESYVHVKTEVGTVIVRIEGATPARPGDRLGLVLPPTALHLFDDAGHALAHPVAQPPPVEGAGG